MADTYSRLYQTNLGGFHQLIALNESYINKSFESMYKLADPESPLKSFNRTVRGVATMQGCTLLEPKVVLMVEDNQFNYLKYYLKFKSGDLTIFYGEDDEKSFKVDGWIFVFQIFIEADTSNKRLQKESYFGGLDWEAEDEEIQENFDTFIQKWITATAKAGQTLIGVTVQPMTNSVASQEATFPPTFLAKQTLNVNLTWNITLQIASISDGGLEIKVKPLGEGEKYHSCTYNVEDHLDWPGMSSNLDDYGRYVQSYLDGIFAWRMPMLVSTLVNKLNNQNKLYMPGAGSFFFKNGTFNSKGDFLTEIKYDGTNWDEADALERYAKRQEAADVMPQPEKPEPLKPLKLSVNLAEAKAMHMQGWNEHTFDEAEAAGKGQDAERKI
ncbi:hypothetical protein P7C71_g1976, partial [Lecanoromycetidae sp. Uapishka_2]